MMMRLGDLIEYHVDPAHDWERFEIDCVDDTAVLHRFLHREIWLVEGILDMISMYAVVGLVGLVGPDHLVEVNT